MAAVQENGPQTQDRSRHRKVHKPVKLDMTPMVDLAFLLLTFFILTTTMVEQKTLQLAFPVDGDPSEVNSAITLIPTRNNTILYYVGEWKTGMKLQKTDYRKIRKILIGLNQTALKKIHHLETEWMHKSAEPGAEKDRTDKDYAARIEKIKKENTSLYCIIKPDKFAKYRNMIDLVDEMEVCGVGKYSVIDHFQDFETENLDRYYATVTAR